MRPYVANIDTLIIVVALIPQPDWILIEKLLLNCHIQKIRPIICINKSDLLTDSEIEEWLKPYKDEIETVTVSSKTLQGVPSLIDMIKGQLACFAGQSAVEAKIIDTCGFSILETVDVEYSELMYYYDSFVKLQSQCRFPNCTHTTEPQCAVKKGVNTGEINQQRYERYLDLFNELKENWRTKYE